MVNGLHLYHAFIQSTLQYCLTFTHSYTDGALIPPEILPPQVFLSFCVTSRTDQKNEWDIFITIYPLLTWIYKKRPLGSTASFTSRTTSCGATSPRWRASAPRPSCGCSAAPPTARGGTTATTWRRPRSCWCACCSTRAGGWASSSRPRATRSSTRSDGGGDGIRQITLFFPVAVETCG